MIRPAGSGDMDKILNIYAGARRFMEARGNPTQWAGGYPQRELLEEDIRRGELYVICGGDGRLRGVIAFILGEDPTYAVIEKGAWLNHRPYGTIHRLAGDGSGGIFRECLDFCLTRCPDLRADTHEKNIPMQRVLERNGFRRCGYINVDKKYGDTLRIAYQYQVD